MGLAMGLFADQTAICEKVVTTYTKDRMINDDSFKKVKFDLKEKDGQKFGILTFKGTNVYGGIVENMTFFYLDVNGSKCSIKQAVPMGGL